MSAYTYPTSPNITFGNRDNLAPGDPSKRISGAAFDVEFNALVVATADTLNKNNPSFTGTMTGGGVVDGGTF
jgi:hypothetical protein